MLLLRNRRNKTLFIAIVAVLVLSACSSKSAIDDQDGNKEVTPSVNIEENITDSAIDTTEEYANNNSEEVPSVNVEEPLVEEGFKKAYIEIIESERERKAIATENSDYDELSDCIDSYWIYDIDKNGVPEFLVKYGDCEAAFHGRLYSYIDGKAKFIDDVSMGHTGFYAVPGENGLLSYMGHMGVSSCSKLTLDGTELSSVEVYSEDINEKLLAGEDVWYKDANEIVDGAYYLDSYDYNNTYPIEMYNFISDYSNGKAKTVSESYSFPNDDPNFYTDIMQNNGMVNVVALDQYMNTLGEVPFSTILEEDQIYDYIFAPLKITDICYADLNSDGIYECIFYIYEDDESEYEDNEFRVILSLQDGNVYAYVEFFPPEVMITEDGYFITENSNSSERCVRRVIYNRGKCFVYTVPSEG